ncbi:phospholipase A2 inhibitor gamma subunit B-like [Bufo gargarizans]|uniref:phospholipase A2 inhibitor gamma subunit B-like n=1 Tax=Bufo gargarizans TaxID=30331 RepID=UPI001CF164E4|nr:phospholipase A2 inhibitor gamma subunit B-like [Bufo gargarizans]
MRRTAQGVVVLRLHSQTIPVLSLCLCLAGLALMCISCTSTTRTPCTGSAVTCASTEDVCTYIFTETKIRAHRLTTYTVVRGCGQSSECNRKSLSNQIMTVEINTACCKADKCTPVAPIVSSGNASKNGLICPSCFSVTSSTCVPDTKIQCTGNETRCSTYSISTTTKPPKPVLSMAGCATENMCSNYTGTATSSVTGKMNISIGCSNATVNPSTGSPSSTPASVSTSRPAPITTGTRTTIHALTHTDIANSYRHPNSSAVYYTTRVTFMPTSTTRKKSVTSTSNGAAKPRFGPALIMAVTFLVVKNFL